MTPIIPNHLQADDGIIIPVVDPQDRFKLQGPPPELAWSDQDYIDRWGPEWVPNVAILRKGQSVLFPMLTLRGAPASFNKVRGHMANSPTVYVTRQQADGLRLWRVK